MNSAKSFFFSLLSPFEQTVVRLGKTADDPEQNRLILKKGGTNISKVCTFFFWKWHHLDFWSQHFGFVGAILIFFVTVQKKWCLNWKIRCPFGKKWCPFWKFQCPIRKKWCHHFSKSGRCGLKAVDVVSKWHNIFQAQYIFLLEVAHFGFSVSPFSFRWHILDFRCHHFPFVGTIWIFGVTIFLSLAQFEFFFVLIETT